MAVARRRAGGQRAPRLKPGSARLRRRSTAGSGMKRGATSRRKAGARHKVRGR